MNEAYLNWAERSAGHPFDGGSIIKPKWYDIERAVPGGPVHLPGVEEPLKHMIWRERWPTRTAMAYNLQRTRSMEYQEIGWSIPIPEGLDYGDTFEAAETRYWRQPGEVKTWTVTRTMQPWDPTMKHFWSGQQAYEFYSGMFEHWSRALRETNPDVTILGGWDFNYSAGNWDVWTELYRPLLKDFPKHIDGLTEHHYGIQPALIQAWYELGTGEAMAITGRWLRNGILKPKVGSTRRCMAASPMPLARWKTKPKQPTGRPNITLLTSLASSPALRRRRPHTICITLSAKAFDHRGAWSLRLLKALRGDLIAVDTSDQRLWAAASAPESGGTTLALDHAAAEDMTVSLPSWDAGTATVHRLVPLDLSELEEVTRDTPLLKSETKTIGQEIVIPSRTAVIITYEEQVDSSTTFTRKQFFPKEGGLLNAGGESGDLTLKLMGEIPEGPAPRMVTPRRRSHPRWSPM